MSELLICRLRMCCPSWLWVVLMIFCVSHKGNAQDEGLGVASSADYYYNGYQYDVNVGEILVDSTYGTYNVTRESIAEASDFLNRVASFGAWGVRRESDSSLGIGAQVEMRTFLPFPRMNHNMFNSQRAYKGIQIGPFQIYDPSVGAGLLYSDYQGENGRFRDADRDHWAAIVWGSIGISMYVSQTFALSLRPFIYWLPLEGKVGWDIGSFGFGLLGADLMPRSLFEMAYVKDIGTWELTIYDQFNVRMMRQSLLDTSVFYAAGAQDMSPFDTAGRYSLGGEGTRYIGSSRGDDLSIADRIFENTNVLYHNQARAALSGLLAESIYTTFYYTRYDEWDHRFDHAPGWNTFGVLFEQHGFHFRRYIGYQTSFRDESDYVDHQLFAGFNASLSSSVSIDGMAGYFWNEGGREHETAVGRLGIDHAISNRTVHGLAVGRTVTDPEFGTRTLADYIRYYLAYQVSRAMELRLFVQRANFSSLDDERPFDRESLSAGALLDWKISNRSRLLALNTYERAKFDNPGREWQLWTHRISYMRSFSDSLSGHAFYQYQHASTGGSWDNGGFSEHLFYMGIVKYF